MEAGWVVTEVGRQPWIVYRVLLVSHAVTPSSGVPVTLGVILALYAILTVVSIGVPMIMSRRWRQETPAEEEAEQVPYGPSPAGASPAGPACAAGRAPGIHWRAGGVMNPSPEAIAVAAILFVVIAAYALFGGADFGGGIWDLLAGGAERGAAPRELIDESITPVWEGNHVWLVFVLVLLWTAFPPAFAAIMTALFVPLSLSLLGIVLRGAGFAFRHTAQRLRMRQLTGAVFAAASLITPFFMGTVVGAVATGQVPVHPAGNVLAAWTSPTAILTGFLFVAACAYVSAVFLVLEARQRGHQDLTRYFSLRATAAGVVTGALAGGTFAELSASAPYVYAPPDRHRPAAGGDLDRRGDRRAGHALAALVPRPGPAGDGRDRRGDRGVGLGTGPVPLPVPHLAVAGRGQRAHRGPGSGIRRRGPRGAARGARRSPCSTSCSNGAC